MTTESTGDESCEESKNGENQDFPAPSQRQPVKKSAPSPPPPDAAGDQNEKQVPPAKEYAKVLFEYIAEHEDELSLAVGEVVRVVSKTCEDSGWWLGELSNGKRGVFPDNFVQIVPPDQVPESVITKPAAATTGVSHTTQSAPQVTSPTSGGSTTIGHGVVPPAVPVKPKSLSARAGVADPPAFPTTHNHKGKSLDDDGPLKAAAVSGIHGQQGQPTSAAGETERGKPKLAGVQEDGVVTRLTHIGVARPRQGGKRPPSANFLNAMRSEDQNSFAPQNNTPSSPEPDSANDMVTTSATSKVINKHPPGKLPPGAMPVLPAFPAGSVGPVGSGPVRSGSGGRAAEPGKQGGESKAPEPEGLRELRLEFEAFKAETARKMKDFEFRLKKFNDDVNVKL